MKNIAFVILIASFLVAPAFAEPIAKSGLVSKLISIEDAVENTDLNSNKDVNPAALNLKLAERTDLTKYGFNLFKSTSNTESFTLRSGLSKLSSQAAASVELIVKW